MGIKNFEDFVNEEFISPEKTLSDRLPGGQKRYEKRLKKTRDHYFEAKQEDFLKEFSECESMQDLLNLNTHMMEYGYQSPIAGQVRNGDYSLKGIRFISADRDSEYTALDLVKSIEKEKSENIDTILTYKLSWAWWCANILRGLFYWDSPYGTEADENIHELMKKHCPSCPADKKDDDDKKK